MECRLNHRSKRPKKQHISKATSELLAVSRLGTLHHAAFCWDYAQPARSPFTHSCASRSAIVPSHLHAPMQRCSYRKGVSHGQPRVSEFSIQSCAFNHRRSMAESHAVGMYHLYGARSMGCSAILAKGCGTQAFSCCCCLQQLKLTW